ncbi:MAG: hypothetical protein ACRC0X_09900 [Brevinema sp.]
MPSPNKLQYDQFVLTKKKEIQEYKQQISNLQSQFTQNENVNRYICLAMITYELKIIEIYFRQHNLYESLLDTYNKNNLDHIRKIFSEIIILLKQHFVVSLSHEFSKTQDYLQELDKLTPQRILNLLSQMEYLCSNLKISYGHTSKYIISITNIYGDICGFGLNIIDFPKYLNAIRDLRHPEYNSIQNLLELMVTILDRASTFYMDAYNTAGDDKELVRKAIQVLSLLETYYRITKQNSLLPELERKKQSWERGLS